MRKEKEKLKTRAKNYAKTKKNKSRAKQNRW